MDGFIGQINIDEALVIEEGGIGLFYSYGVDILGNVGRGWGLDQDILDLLYSLFGKLGHVCICVYVCIYV